MVEKFDGVSPKLDEESFVHKGATLIGKVELGKQVSIWPGAVLRGDTDTIVVGDRSNIQDNTVCHCEKGKPLTLGKDVTVGHMCTLHACTIEDSCLIGMGAIVLDESVIGAGSIVGAGSLVTKGTIAPAQSLLLGSPAKVVKSLADSTLADRKKHAKDYWQLAKKYL